ncbi:hypothetical protein AC3_A0658 [Clostridium perfringens E str. JGS1987]|uniref:Uncharacterized protein n=1 Tax=Clostridium perfringens E str. JGS1987 TaxID=451755 RepID=B1BVS5_CLOPF|nr:hypothetical protein AC3_A0658 [Clostridium perfringens E str. JGS1987]
MYYRVLCTCSFFRSGGAFYIKIFIIVALVFLNVCIGIKVEPNKTYKLP